MRNPRIERYLTDVRLAPASLGMRDASERLERLIISLRREHSSELRHWQHKLGERWLIRFNLRNTTKDLTMALRVLRAVQS